MTKTALITGAGRGIGRGIALALATRGWDIVINYHSNQIAAEQTAVDVRATGVQAIVVRADIADLNSHMPLVQQTVTHFGRIDMLVNNAGMAPRQRVDLLDVSESSFDEVMATNLKGPFFYLSA